MERHAAGSPARALLEWWRAMQFDNATAAAALLRRFTSARRPSSSIVSWCWSRTAFGGAAAGGRGRRAGRPRDGARPAREPDRATPTGGSTCSALPRSFNLVRENGDWRLADNALSSSVPCATQEAPGRGAARPDACRRHERAGRGGAARAAARRRHDVAVARVAAARGARLALLVLGARPWPSRAASCAGDGYEVATAERLLRFSRASLRRPPGPARRLASVPGYLRGWRAWLRRQDADLIHANSVLALPEVASRPRAVRHSCCTPTRCCPRGMKGCGRRPAGAPRGCGGVGVRRGEPGLAPLRDRVDRGVPGGPRARAAAAHRRRPIRWWSAHSAPCRGAREATCSWPQPGASRSGATASSSASPGSRWWAESVPGRRRCWPARAQRSRPRGPGRAVRRAAEVGHLRAALAHGPVSACAARGDGRGAARGGHAGGRDTRAGGPRRRSAGDLRGRGRPGRRRAAPRRTRPSCGLPWERRRASGRAVCSPPRRRRTGSTASTGAPWPAEQPEPPAPARPG